MSLNYLIGCGGVGSWLAPVLVKQLGPEAVILVDGDTLEQKNLDRQLFELEDIGRNKAEALALKYGCAWEMRWFSRGIFRLTRQDWLLVAVDNHPARLAALQECDQSGCQALFAANETFSAEAFYYRREWRDTPLDPRRYYPELLTDSAGDPRAAAIGCTGEAQTANRQLATANFMAAALLLNLRTIWQDKAPRLKREARQTLPYKITSNLFRMEMQHVKDGSQTNANERTNQ